MSHQVFLYKQLNSKHTAKYQLDLITKKCEVPASFKQYSMHMHEFKVYFMH